MVRFYPGQLVGAFLSVFSTCSLSRRTITPLTGFIGALAWSVAHDSVAMAMSTATCESEFLQAGLQDGEEYLTPVRLAATLATITVTSAWYSAEKIKRLSLFFAHWLS